MAKKSRVKMQPKIEVGNLDPKPVEGKHIEIAKKIEKLSKPALLISRLNYPITIKYDKSNIRLSPRGRAKIANLDLLKEKDKLPAGLMIKKL